MPNPLDRLIALAVADIERATLVLNGGGSVATWRKEMERIITTQTTAAYITATAQRLGIPADSALISRARLSRAERADIARQVQDQLRFLNGFQAALGTLSPAQVLARARLYATGPRAFYSAMRWAEWEIPDRLLPGRQTCMGNCRCELTGVSDNGDGTGVLTRVMRGSENHCTECPPLAGDHVVRRRRAA